LGREKRWKILGREEAGLGRWVPVLAIRLRARKKRKR
jgi:hypothetical protein